MIWRAQLIELLTSREVGSARVAAACRNSNEMRVMEP